MSQARNHVAIIKRNKKKEQSNKNQCKNKQIQLQNNKKNHNYAHQQNYFCMKMTHDKLNQTYSQQIISIVRIFLTLIYNRK